jgi:uncharacterized membrane protein YecN with MAPEG domain
LLIAAPVMILTSAVTVLAALVCLGTAILVARVRRREKISPPAMTGSFAVECALRVQGNTTEQVVIFLPVLWIATLYFQGWVPPLIGLVWCLARILYAYAYMSEPKSRSVGFALSVFCSIGLAILSIWGLIQAWTVASAS